MRPVLILIALAACERAPDPVDDSDPPAVDDSDPVSPPDDSDTPIIIDTDVPPPVVSGEPAEVSTSGVIVCADPSGRATPFRLHEPAGDWARQPVDPRSGSLFVGGGLAVADWTGDGLLDVMLTSYQDAFRFYVGQPDLSFVDGTAGLPPMPERTSGVTAVDVDGDADLDAYVATFTGPNVLLLNDGTGRFTDVAQDQGARGDPDLRWMSSTWADVDGDGDLDGFVAAYGAIGGQGGLPEGDPSMLLLRQDDGTYVDTVPGYPEDHPLRKAHTFLASFNDVTGDGRPDLYMVNDFGWKLPSQLLTNEVEGFRRWDTGAESRLENMGLGVGDTNGDGQLDFLVAAWDGLRLFESAPGDLWFETAAAQGLVLDIDNGQNVAWGTELADLDNDGDLDVWTAIGYLNVRSNNTNPQEQPDGAWIKGDDGLYHDVSAAWGLDDPARNRSVVVVDLNGDGWLDAVRTDLRGPADILLASCGDAGWLELAPRQPGPNPFAIGARVDVHAGGVVQRRDVRAGGTGYGSGGPPEVHFGTGAAPILDRVVITWPDGAVTELSGVAPRQRLVVTREATP